MNCTCKEKTAWKKAHYNAGAVTPVIRNTSLCKRHKVSHGVMSFRTKYNLLRIKLNVKVAWILNVPENTWKMVHSKGASLLP